jgi:xylulokinase
MAKPRAPTPFRYEFSKLVPRRSGDFLLRADNPKWPLSAAFGIVRRIPIEERHGMPLVLSIDLGTSGPKVGLLNERGEILAWAFEPVGLTLLPEGGAEQDPEEWWNAILIAFDRVKRDNPVDPGEVAAVVCTGQWSGTVAVDSAGKALAPAILWMDARGGEMARRITGGFPSLHGYGLWRLWTWIRKSGGIPGQSGKDPLAHILFLREKHPEVYRRTHKFLEPKDYLNLRLTGKFAASHCSIALHWVTDNRRLERVDYDPGLLALAGIEREKLPDLFPAHEVLGPLAPEAARQLGISPQARVFLGTPDVHSSAVGAGAVDDRECCLYVGTSSWISCHTSRKKTDVIHNIAALPSCLPGKYLVTNEQETGGACLDFLRKNFFSTNGAARKPVASAEAGDFEALLDLARQSPPGAEGVLFSPWLNGERAPVDDPDARGGFQGLSLKTGRADLARAVLEGVACNSRWLLDHVEDFVGRPLSALRITGGGARSDLWCQVYADVLGKTVRQVKDPVLVNIRGAGLLALEGMGAMAVEDFPAAIPIERDFEPNPDHRAVYDTVYRRFRKSYKLQKGMLCP